MVVYHTVKPSTNSASILYVVQEETTYTYDREDNSNDYDLSSSSGKVWFSNLVKQKVKRSSIPCTTKGKN